MTKTTDRSVCSDFLDNLEAWLSGELDAERSVAMEAHHDGCAACRGEARLAHEITGILIALPQPTCPDIRVPAQARYKDGETFITRLLSAWRQPLVLVPTFALALALGAIVQLREPQTAIEPEVVVIDGREYTREEIQRAARDLELALQYIDRYGTAKVISAELQDSLPEQEDSDEDVPTI